MSGEHEHVYAVIMAGGSGTRFWPVSRGERPKQLTRILGEETMIQATLARLAGMIPPERVLVITTAAIAAQTRAQLPQLPPENVIAEPVGRDTAACVCLAAGVVERMDSDGVMILLPADQLIQPVDAFQNCLAAGVEVARRECGLVTYGIPPRFAATGYGYVKQGAAADAARGCSVHVVERFVEKPDQATAEGYLEAGCYLWNSGIFTWRADVVLSELARHCPQLTAALEPVRAQWGTERFDAALEAAYQPLEKISVDYALMEKVETIHVVTADFDWDDVGSWDALHAHLDPDAQGVASRGESLVLDCRNTLVFNEDGPLVAVSGMDDVIVISTANGVLVCPRGGSQSVKQVVGELKQRQREDLL